MSRTLQALPFSEGHPVREFLATLDSEESRRTQYSALKMCASLMQKKPTGSITTFRWDEITPEDLARLRGRLVERYRPSTARRYLAAVRGVLESAFVLGLLDGDRYARLTHRRALRPIRGESAPPGRALAPEEVERLLRACAADHGHTGARDAAVIATLIGAGLRRVELVGLDLAAVDLPGQTLTVLGKGRRERVVPIPADVAAALEDWIEVRGQWPGPLFVPLGREGSAAGSSGRRISPSAVKWLLDHRAHQAGLPHLSAHDCRRTYVSGLLDDGHGLHVAARLAGHKDIATTARYDRHGEARARAAGEARQIPYVRTPRPALQPLKG